MERLRAESERVTPLITGMPGGGPNADKLPAAVSRIIDAQQGVDRADQLLPGDPTEWWR